MNLLINCRPETHKAISLSNKSPATQHEECGGLGSEIINQNGRENRFHELNMPATNKYFV